VVFGLVHGNKSVASKCSHPCNWFIIGHGIVNGAEGHIAIPQQFYCTGIVYYSKLGAWKCEHKCPGFA